MYTQYFIILVKINNCRLTTIIDFDTIDNFIIRALIKREEYFTQKKFNAYNLVIVDKNLLFVENKRENKETKILSITI